MDSLEVSFSLESKNLRNINPSSAFLTQRYFSLSDLYFKISLLVILLINLPKSIV